MPDPEEKTTDVQTEKVQTTPKSEDKKDGYTLPEKDFFSGDSMNKFAEEIDLFKEAPKEAPKVEPKEEEKAKEKPCSDCDEEGREPIDWYTHNGERVPVYTDEQRRALMQKGHDYDFKRQRDSADRRGWEESVDRREADLARVGNALEQLIQLNRSQNQADDEPKVDPRLETIDDPAVRDTLQDILQENKQLKGKLSTFENESREGKMKKAGEQLDAIYDTVRDEYPFEQIVDDEGSNITEQVFAGLLSVKVNEDRRKADRDPSFKLKDMPHYMRETAKSLANMERFYKVSGNGGQEITADFVIENHRDVAQEIGQRAIAAYIKNENENSAPVARAETTDATREKKSEDKLKSLDDYLNAAVDDPEISAELNKIKTGV